MQDRANLALEFAYEKDKKLQIAKTKEFGKSKPKFKEKDSNIEM